MKQTHTVQEEYKGLRLDVFSSNNILAIGLQFATVFLIALLGGWLLGKPLKHLLLVFPIIFLLTQDNIKKIKDQPTVLILRIIHNKR